MTEQERERKRMWRLTHPASVKASKIAHYARNKERERAKNKARYSDGSYRARAIARAKQRYALKKAAILAKRKEQYSADPRHFLSANKQRRSASPDIVRELDRKYAKAYQEKDRQRFLAKVNRATQKRRALKIGAFIETVDRSVVFVRDKGRCGICGTSVDPDSKWHVDHVVPLSQGGVHSYANVQLAHARCNLSKRGTLPAGQIGLFQKKVAGGRT